MGVFLSKDDFEILNELVAWICFRFGGDWHLIEFRRSLRLKQRGGSLTLVADPPEIISRGSLHSALKKTQVSAKPAVYFTTLTSK